MYCIASDDSPELSLSPSPSLLLSLPLPLPLPLSGHSADCWCSIHQEGSQDVL